MRNPEANERRHSLERERNFNLYQVNLSPVTSKKRPGGSLRPAFTGSRPRTGAKAFPPDSEKFGKSVGKLRLQRLDRLAVAIEQSLELGALGGAGGEAIGEPGAAGVSGHAQLAGDGL